MRKKFEARQGYPTFHPKGEPVIERSPGMFYEGFYGLQVVRKGKVEAIVAVDSDVLLGGVQIGRRVVRESLRRLEADKMVVIAVSETGGRRRGFNMWKDTMSLAHSPPFNEPPYIYVVPMTAKILSVVDRFSPEDIIRTRLTATGKLQLVRK